MTTLYDQVGVNQFASQEELRAAMIKRAGALKEARDRGDMEAALAYDEITRAYAVLGNKQKREEYDRTNRPRPTLSPSFPPPSPKGKFNVVYWTLGVLAVLIVVPGFVVAFLIYAAGTAQDQPQTALAPKPKPNYQECASLDGESMAIAETKLGKPKETRVTGKDEAGFGDVVEWVYAQCQLTFKVSPSLDKSLSHRVYSVNRPSPRHRENNTVPSPPASNCDRAAAQSVKEKMSQAVYVTRDDATELTYLFSEEWWSTVSARLPETVTALANADACLEGRARRIKFLKPGGIIVAFADPNQGVKMVY